MKINYFNTDHTHALIDLPTNQTTEQVVQLLKGGSSHWINENRLVKGRFAWGRGYGAFSVSHSDIDRVSRYIANKKNTTGRELLKRSTSCSLSGTAWNGGARKTLKKG
jgi:REP element-mobilizing transposase RayT